MPEDTCSKDMTGRIIVQQGCDRPNDIKAERPNVLPYSKDMTGPIIVQQVCDRSNDIKAKRPNVCTYIKAMTGPIIVLRRYGPMIGPIIVLRRYGPVRATHIMNKGTCNKYVTGQMTKSPNDQMSGQITRL